MDHLALSGAVSNCCGSTVNKKGSAFFGVPRLLVGFSPKGLSEGESVWSPTSPLDLKTFPSSGNCYRSPRSNLKICEQNKVGLSIVDSLDDDPLVALKVLRSLDSKIIVSGLPEANSKDSSTVKSLPRNFAVFPRSNSKSPLEKSHSAVTKEIDSPLFGTLRASSLDSCRKLSSMNRSNTSSQVKSANTIGSASEPLVSSATSPLSINGVAEPLSAEEIELSEDYTCIISHGPNPKTTHIYGDRILECHPSNLGSLLKSSAGEGDREDSNVENKCHCCNEILVEGDDAFVSRYPVSPSRSKFCCMGVDDETLCCCCRFEKPSEQECDGCSEGNCENLLESAIFDV